MQDTVNEPEEPPTSGKPMDDTPEDEATLSVNEDGFSSTLSIASHTPSRDGSEFLTRPAARYNDTVPPNARFWVEINPPKAPFDRELYQINDDEFNVVGVTHHVGGEEDRRYEVQFEDGHTAMVVLLQREADLISYLWGSFCVMITLRRLSRSTKSSFRGEQKGRVTRRSG
jgi:hypothetical protein